MLDINQDNFTPEVEQSQIPVLVDFWAAWCGPCRMLAPVIEQIAAENEGKIKVCKCNVDENADLCARFGIMSIPTVVAFSGGKELDRSVGFTDKDSLLALLD